MRGQEEKFIRTTLLGAEVIEPHEGSGDVHVEFGLRKGRE